MNKNIVKNKTISTSILHIYKLLKFLAHWQNSVQGTSFLEQLNRPLHPLLHPHAMVYSLGRVTSLLLGSRYASKLSQLYTVGVRPFAFDSKFKLSFITY